MDEDKLITRSLFSIEMSIEMMERQVEKEMKLPFKELRG